MKPLTFTRWLPWLLIAVCPPLLGRCGGSVEHGTETGNPPVVEEQKLHIVLRNSGVEVVGDAGAVSPGAKVSVTNRTTGAHAEATAASDGSVNVTVPGSLQDEYDVTVSNAAGSRTVQIAAETSGAMGGSGGSMADAGSSLPGACGALQQTLAARVSAGFSNVDKTCQRDDECVFTRTDASCYSSCNSVIASSTGARAAGTAVLEDIAPLCKEFDDQHCEIPPPTCVAGSPVLVCNGICTQLDTLSCSDLGNGAAARVDDLLDRAPRDCTVDADCSFISFAVRCVATCGDFSYSVAASAVPQLNQAALALQDPLCSEFESRCPPPRPLPCLMPPTSTPQAAVCLNGQCDIQAAPPP